MMTGPDWENRYLSGDMPWEKGEGAPGLVDFLRNHPELPRGRVLVPGCGTGHDARTWARHGFEVHGLDIAPSAIRLAAGRPGEDMPGGTAYFRVADFLREEPFAAFDWIFEHTLFCAIHPSERELYTQALQRWLRPDGQVLAIHYMIRDTEGPPFGCTQEELVERFAPFLELQRGWVPRSYPNRTGLELMLWWRRRPA